MDQQKKPGVPALTLLAAACLLTLLGPLMIAGVARLWTALFALLYGLLFAVGALLMGLGKKSVLRRRWLLPGRPWDAGLRLPAVGLYPVIAALSAADVYVTEWMPLPDWTWMIGAALLAAGYLQLVQCLLATPPHARDLYREAPPADAAQRGAYNLLRHPVEGTAVLLGLSIALFIGSGAGIVAAGAQAALFILYVIREDQWRFQHYEWYYDYTRQVGKKMFLFIW